MADAIIAKMLGMVEAYIIISRKVMEGHGGKRYLMIEVSYT